jgi:hypothetical protein
MTFGCGEKYTAGTLVVEVLEGSSTGDPVAGVDVRLFELGYQGAGPGLPYQTNEEGRFEHSWGWLGGGSEYAARVVITDSVFVPVDSTETFRVRGTREDNFLEWQIVVERR